MKKILSFISCMFIPKIIIINKLNMAINLLFETRREQDILIFRFNNIMKGLEKKLNTEMPVSEPLDPIFSGKTTVKDMLDNIYRKGTK